MSDPSYFEAYPNLALSRSDDGVLTVRFHADGGPLRIGGVIHQDLPDALEQIARDAGNRAMILTGTGDVFIGEPDDADHGPTREAASLEKVRTEHLKALELLLELPLPVVGVANGPATVHAEYLLLTDVHIASDRAAYRVSRDLETPVTTHDGLHVVWDDAIGSVRTKWLVWTGETIDAETALAWGVVAEVVPHARVQDRGRELAAMLAGRPRRYASRQKQSLNQRLERRVNASVQV